MAQDNKDVSERASELREFANKISSLSDEELEEAVGGIDWGRPFEPINQLIDRINNH